MHACSLGPSLIVLYEMVAFDLEVSRLSLLGHVHAASQVSFCRLGQRGLRATLVKVANGLFPLGRIVNGF